MITWCFLEPTSETPERSSTALRHGWMITRAGPRIPLVRAHRDHGLAEVLSGVDFGGTEAWTSPGHSPVRARLVKGGGDVEQGQVLHLARRGPRKVRLERAPIQTATSLAAYKYKEI
jgi:hypothetical protein